MSKFKSNFVMLADYVVEDKSNKISIIGIFDRIYSARFPTVRNGLVLVGNFDVLDKSIESVDLNFTLKDARGNVTGPRDVRIKLDFINAQDKDNKKGNFILRIVSLPFEKDGWYSFFVTANGEDLCECKFLVEKINE